MLELMLLLTISNCIFSFPEPIQNESYAIWIYNNTLPHGYFRIYRLNLGETIITCNDLPLLNTQPLTYQMRGVADTPDNTPPGYTREWGVIQNLVIGVVPKEPTELQ